MPYMEWVRSEKATVDGNPVLSVIEGGAAFRKITNPMSSIIPGD